MPPVFVPLAAAVSAVATPLFAAAASGATLLATLGPAGQILLSIGISAAAAAIQRASLKDRGALAYGLASDDLRLNTRQEVPPQRWIYGDVVVGGPLFFEESIGSQYYQGFLLGEGPISAVEDIRNSHERIPVPPIVFGQIVLPNNSRIGGPNYVGRLEFCVRQGTLGQAIDPILDVDFPNLPNSSFRQRGVATLVAKSQYGGSVENNEILWGSSRRPNYSLRVKGVPVYDPRDGTQTLPADPNDAAQLEAARLTWKWSNTAALVQADYLWRENGGRIPLSQMDWHKIAMSAEYDDQTIRTADGRDIRRHTIDGVVNSGQSPVQILQSMLTANRGFVVRSRGRVWVQSSQPVEPIVTLTDAMIVGGLEIRRSQPKRNLLNRVRCRFIDPRQQWTQVDGPVRDRSDLRTADGDLYEATVDLPYTSEHPRAQRLQKLYLDESRLGRQIRGVFGTELVGLEAGDAVRVELETFAFINGIYRVDSVALSEDRMSVEVTATEYSADIEKSWTAADEQPYTLPDIDLTS